MHRAIELDELHDAGATFAYPEALSSEEWIALGAQQRWIRKLKMDEREKEKFEAEARQQEQEYENVMRGARR